MIVDAQLDEDVRLLSKQQTSSERQIWGIQSRTRQMYVLIDGMTELLHGGRVQEVIFCGQHVGQPCICVSICLIAQQITSLA